MTGIIQQLAQQAGQAIQTWAQSPAVKRAIQNCAPIAFQELGKKFKDWF